MAAQSHFFSHDFNAHNNLKMIELRLEHGWRGYGLFWAILEVMAESDAKLDKQKMKFVSYQLQIKLDELREFIASCLQIGLFQEDEDHLFCEALDERLEHKRKAVEKAKKAAKKRWENKENAELNAQAMQEHSPSNANQTKPNQTKQNNIIEDSKESSPKSPKKTAQEKYEERKEAFRKEVREVGAEYADWLLREFFSYWSEPSPKWKLNKELQKTWDTKRRLQTWVSRLNTDKSPYKPQISKPSQSNSEKELQHILKILKECPEDKGMRIKYKLITGEEYAAT